MGGSKPRPLPPDLKSPFIPAHAHPSPPPHLHPPHPHLTPFSILPHSLPPFHDSSLPHLTCIPSHLLPPLHPSPHLLPIPLTLPFPHPTPDPPHPHSHHPAVQWAWPQTPPLPLSALPPRLLNGTPSRLPGRPHSRSQDLVRFAPGGNRKQDWSGRVVSGRGAAEFAVLCPQSPSGGSCGVALRHER